MSQHYSDPERASDPYALPDVETFQTDRHAEAAAEAEILKRCRATRAGGWVMREGPNGFGAPILCRVIDLRAYSGKRVVAEGECWADVLAILDDESDERKES